MSSLDGPHTLLAKLAPMSAAAWHALGAQAFPGELSVATDNSVYRLRNGIFLGRAKRGARSFDYPLAMRGTRLVGFAFDEGGLWSLSPRWRLGSHAVLWKPDAPEEQAFVLTSPTVELTCDEPEPKPADPGPKPSPWVTAGPPPSRSGIALRRLARPPSIRQPAMTSMTRLHSAVPDASQR